MDRPFHLHLISDATGETLHAVAKATIAQFEGVNVQEHSYALVRSIRQLHRTIDYIREHPGLVFFTLVNQELRSELLAQCAQLGLANYDVMEGPVRVMQRQFGVKETHRPGGQHEVDQRYLQRMEALSYTIEHDDGQLMDDLDGAEVDSGWRQPDLQDADLRLSGDSWAACGQCASGTGRAPAP